MAKSRVPMGRPGGGNIDFSLDDNSALVKGITAFTAKANPHRQTIFRIFPEVENGVISQMRDDESGDLTYFFEQVTIGELGGANSKAKYTSFIADPSDQPELDRSEFPVVKLRNYLDEQLKSSPDWALPFTRWFTPHGPYQGNAFGWPGQYIAVQGFSYMQPGCNNDSKIDGYIERLESMPTNYAEESGLENFGRYLRAPEFKIMFVKGSGIDELQEMFLGRKEGSDEFNVPASILDAGSIIAVRVTGEKVVREDNSEITQCRVYPFNLQAYNRYIPTEHDIKSNFKPWDEVLRKMTYNEQIQRLINHFSENGNNGADLIHRCFGTTINLQPTAQQPTQQQQPAQQQAAANDWNVQQQVAPVQQQVAPVQQQVAPVQQQVAPVQQQVAPVQQQVAPVNDWAAAPTQPVQQQAAPAQPAQGGVTDATTSAASPAGSLSEADIESRYNAYAEGDGT